MTVSQTFLVFDEVFQRSTGQVFCGVSLNWDLSGIFLMIRLGLCIFGKKTREVKKKKVPFHHILYQGYILST